MGVDLEKKRKLLLYPIEYQATVGAAFGLRDGRARTAREAPNHFLIVSSASTTARGATTRTEVMRCCEEGREVGNGRDSDVWIIKGMIRVHVSGNLSNCGMKILLCTRSCYCVHDHVHDHKFNQGPRTPPSRYHGLPVTR